MKDANQRGIKDTRGLGPFMASIQRNCDIADASGAGIFSICGMALRLRDLNKWEKGLHPWEENQAKALLDWIDQKEKKWTRLEGKAFCHLPFMGRVYDPFDTIAVNRALFPLDLFYGAGYAHALKPSFFLARIQETRVVNGIPVFILGRELQRDLLTIPALNQDGNILIRRDAARLFFWDQMAYLKKSGHRFLRFALKACGLADTGIETRKARFEDILGVQEQICIHHEIGEILDRVFDRRIFRGILSQMPHTPAELLARTVKDLLADTGAPGTLDHIISTRNVPALGFYAAFQDGLFRPLFPQLRPAVERFVSDKDWGGIESAREKGFSTAEQYAGDLKEICADVLDPEPDPARMDRLAAAVNENLVQPLI